MAPEQHSAFASLAEAERCVACGLCLPQCPTYVLTHDENESPRGRLSLMRALGSGNLAPSAGIFAHIDRCLGCRRCEALCPAEVPYGRLLDATRARLYADAGVHTAWRLRLLKGLVIHPRAMTLLSSLARLAQRLGLAALWPELAQLPPPGPRLPAGDAATDTGIVLFRGCLASAFDRETLAAAEKLLQAAGIRYRTSGPACCGALHQHNGDAHAARAIAEANRERFAGAHTVLYCASGCGATLLDYPRLVPQAESWPVFTELTAFLANTQQLQAIRFADTQQRVLVHEPCSSRNVTRGGGATRELLARLPGLAVTPLEYSACCGAAGAYHLLQPKMAAQLRARLLEPILESGADILVTTNLGCQLWLGAVLRAHGMQVINPLTLLARQLP